MPRNPLAIVSPFASGSIGVNPAALWDRAHVDGKKSERTSRRLRKQDV